ncbi:TetR family transcriptional regulator [uncultured Corynebacterium sp.]|uniref:TetR family transcriptional regulator n=1 Tax=uncultured Corynebacterium sp. TaxID=159447 RepID=UPI0025CF55FD|nr:TetR family transcriptional regulator [uncultured Corynebacterium sp.]
MTIPEQPSLRELKRQQTLEAIEDNATRLVLERGFDDVTVEDICAGAGISKRTFFNYVESKEVAVVGPGPRMPTEEEHDTFLATEHDDLLNAALDLMIQMFGDHDHSGPGLPEDIKKRRKCIRSDHPDLAMHHFTKVHQARAGIEGLVAEYLRRWPSSQRLQDSPESEAITTVGVLLIAVYQGSRAWHDDDSIGAADFRTCCHDALTNIFLLKGGQTT